MHGFTATQIDLGATFEQLEASLRFETVAIGRKGVHLTRPGPRGVPLVRTTTCYRDAAQPFGSLHEAIVERVVAASCLPQPGFNHALAELYEPQYRKMGYHSDQALDLDPGSTVAVVSCYDRDVGPDDRGVRQLMVKSKTTDERFTLPMQHGSVIEFSVATNARFAHKIILPTADANAPRWIGLTLRQAKTFVTWRDGKPYFEDGSALVLADDEQRHTFFRLCGAENRAPEFEYPPLHFTVSDGDLLPPG
jgi:hypothetical protein